MDNLDGSLAFKATLDINDFNVSAQAMEQQIRKVSTTAMTEAENMDESILSFARNGAQYIVSYLVGQGMYSLMQSIVQTRGQFQQLEIAFGTMLKSGTQAQMLMNRLVEVAAKTPFDLQGIAMSAKQMLAYGSTVDTVVDELVMLGNVASGVGAPLSEIAYLYGTLRTQGRAYTVDIRQFAGRGIPIYEELANVLGVTKNKVSELVEAGKVGFPEVEKAFQNMTSSAGIYYNLMEEQSKSLTGMISNMGDAWDSMLNEIGKNNQDLFAGAISSATSLIENYDKILNIIKAITVAYGSYKAALVVNSLVTKGCTGVAVLDNTVRQAKIALMKVEAQLTGQVANQTKAMKAATDAHVAALQQQLTAEERANVVKQIRIATIQQLLTEQQKEYLSFLGLTASSENYEQAAMGALTVEQREALGKIDLTEKSVIYRNALEKEVAAKQQSRISSLESLKAQRTSALSAAEAARSRLVAAKQNVATAQMELTMAKQSGDATRVANAQKKVEITLDAEVAAKKKLLAAQSLASARSKQYEAAASKQAASASAIDTAAKGAQSTATSILTTVTNRCTLAMKTLWAAMKSNPIGWIITILGTLYSAFLMFRNEEEEAVSAMGEFQDTTNKEINELNQLFAVLKNVESGTTTHKKAVDRINEICKQYNKTLLSENSTLAEQQRIYNELTQAIQATTAEKIKAKYIDQINEEKAKNQDAGRKEFVSSVRGAQRVTSTNTAFGRFNAFDDVEGLKNLSDATFDYIDSYIRTKAETLKNLTGEEYGKAVKEVEGEIRNILKEASGEDMSGVFLGDKISKYIETIVRPAREASQEISKITDELGTFGSKNVDKVVESVDYAKMDFEELDKKIRETQKSIDDLNAKTVKVDADNKELEELTNTLTDLKKAVLDKESSLNTEKGISDRIKQLKEERETVEINSSKYKQLTATIEKLENRMPKKNAEKTDDTLRQKQLEADRKLEQDRIAVMEEGYEKRKALLDLQHKQALAQIDKEEKELKDARKKAGKGTLTSAEQAGFDERRNLENRSYELAQNKLFDGEIDYKKQQYQLYFRWVRNMGEEVANQQFRTLLKGGASFRDYVDRQIQELEKKQSEGSLTTGEGNQLISLRMQYDEITGAKSAIDSFRESITRSVEQAQTLADKLEALAAVKAKLENGESGLVGADEKAQASLLISQEEAKLQIELQNTVLNKFRTFEEQKLSILKEYSLLRKAAQETDNTDRINQVNQAEREALSALNANFLKQSDSWKKLFSDLDSLSSNEIATLIADIESRLRKSDLKLNPVDYKALLDSLEQARAKLIEKNPFRAMNEYYDAYVKAKEKLATAKADLANGNGSDEDVKIEEANMKRAAKGMTDAIESVTETASDCGNTIANMFSELGEDELASGLSTAISLMDQLGNAASSVGKIISGSNVLGGITGMVGAVSSIVGIFSRLHDAKYEKRIKNLQTEIDQLESSYSRLERSYNNTYWVFTDEQNEAYRKNIQLIEDQIALLEEEAQVAKENWDYTRYAELNKQLSDLNRNLKQAREQGDMFTLYQEQIKNLQEQQQAIREQIQNEQDKKKTDENKVQSWTDSIESINQQIEDLNKQMMETLSGTDVNSAINEFADALVDAYCQGEDAAEALGEKTKAVLKNAVVEALKRQFLAKGINDAVSYLGEAMKDNVLSDAEKQEFERQVNVAGSLFNSALEGIGDWIKDIKEEEESLQEDPLTGATRSLSEETGGVIAGRLNAFIINQSDQTAIIRQALVYQAEIAANTKVSAAELSEIRSSLNRIESSSKDNSLLSQGIS